MIRLTWHDGEVTEAGTLDQLLDILCSMPLNPPKPDLLIRNLVDRAAMPRPLGLGRDVGYGGTPMEVLVRLEKAGLFKLESTLTA